MASSAVDTQTVICANCKDNRQVTHFCLGCNVNICMRCKDGGQHRQHHVLHRGHPEIQNAIHNLHKKQPQKDDIPFCMRCYVPIYPHYISERNECIYPHYISKKNKYSFCNLEKAAKEAKDEIQTHLSYLEKVALPSFECCSANILNDISEYQKSISQAREKCKNVSTHLRSLIDRAEDELMKQFEEHEKRDLIKMEAIRKENEEKSNNIKSLITASKSILADSSNIELLIFRAENAHIITPHVQHYIMPPLVEFSPTCRSLPSSAELLGRINRRGKTK